MSYGTNAPFGLKPTYMLDGSTWNNQTSTYSILSGYGTSIFQGDPVTLAPTGATQGNIIIGTAGSAIVGVFMNCIYQVNNQIIYSNYWPAGTAVDANTTIQAQIVDDPFVLFDIQGASFAGGGNTNTIAANSIGYNANFAVGGAQGGAGNTQTGISAYYLNIDGIPPVGAGTTATSNLKIVRFTPNPQNPGAAVNTVGPINPVAAYNNVLVLINNHIYKGGTGTTGL